MCYFDYGMKFDINCRSRCVRSSLIHSGKFLMNMFEALKSEKTFKKFKN